jgi:hypothetical protein
MVFQSQSQSHATRFLSLLLALVTLAGTLGAEPLSMRFSFGPLPSSLRTSRLFKQEALMPAIEWTLHPYEISSQWLREMIRHRRQSEESETTTVFTWTQPRSVGQYFRPARFPARNVFLSASGAHRNWSDFIFYSKALKPSSLKPVSGAPPSSASAKDEKIITRKLQTQLDQIGQPAAWAFLSRGVRDVVVLTTIRELSAEEIGQKLKLSEAEVRSAREEACNIWGDHLAGKPVKRFSTNFGERAEKIQFYLRQIGEDAAWKMIPPKDHEILRLKMYGTREPIISMIVGKSIRVIGIHVERALRIWKRNLPAGQTVKDFRSRKDEKHPLLTQLRTAMVSLRASLEEMSGNQTRPSLVVVRLNALSRTWELLSKELSLTMSTVMRTILPGLAPIIKEAIDLMDDRSWFWSRTAKGVNARIRELTTVITALEEISSDEALPRANDLVDLAALYRRGLALLAIYDVTRRGAPRAKRLAENA